MQQYNYRPRQHQYTGSLEAEIGGYGGEEVQEVVTPRNHHRPARHLRNTEEAVIAHQRTNQQRIDNARAKQQTPANTRQSRATNSRRVPEQRSRYTQPASNIQDDEENTDGEYDDVWPPLQPTSAIRYTLPPEGVYQTGNKRVHVKYADIPPRRSAQTQLPPSPQQQTRYTDEIDELETERPPTRRRRGLHLHWLAILGLGGVIMLALWLFGQMVVSAWQLHQDDVTYGRPRTFQIDQVVGHNDSADNPSHFEAINLNRHIIVIELPGGDSSKARIYNITTLFGIGQELTPATISFKDVNNDGLLDMEIHIQGQTIVFINENGEFRPLKPTEHIHL